MAIKLNIWMVQPSTYSQYKLTTTLMWLVEKVKNNAQFVICELFILVIKSYLNTSYKKFIVK